MRRLISMFVLTAVASVVMMAGEAQACHHWKKSKCTPACEPVACAPAPVCEPVPVCEPAPVVVYETVACEPAPCATPKKRCGLFGGGLFKGGLCGKKKAACEPVVYAPAPCATPVVTYSLRLHPDLRRATVRGPAGRSGPAGHALLPDQGLIENSRILGRSLAGSAEILANPAATALRRPRRKGVAAFFVCSSSMRHALPKPTVVSVFRKGAARPADSSYERETGAVDRAGWTGSSGPREQWCAMRPRQAHPDRAVRWHERDCQAESRGPLSTGSRPEKGVSACDIASRWHCP